MANPKIVVPFFALRQFLRSGNSQDPQAAAAVLAALFELDLPSVTYIRTLLTEMKTTVDEIIAYMEKHKELEASLQNNLKQIIVEIIRLYGNTYLTLNAEQTSELIKDFFLRRSFLLNLDYMSKFHQTSEDKDAIEEEKDDWVKSNTLKTKLHQQCIAALLSQLREYPEKIKLKKLSVTMDFIKSVYFIDDSVQTIKMAAFITEIINKLEVSFSDPSKQLLADATKEQAELLIEHIIKILRFMKEDTIKQRTLLLGPLLGISMLRQPVLDRKIAGAKILSKFSYQITYKSSTFLTEKQLADWLTQQKCFQLLFESNFQLPVIKAAEDCVRLLVKRSQLSLENYKYLFDLIEKSKDEMRRHMYKLIDPWRVNFHQYEMFLEVLGSSVRSDQFYDQELFLFLESLARHITHRQTQVLLKLIKGIMDRQYPQLKTYHQRKKITECYTTIFDFTLADKKSRERIDSYLNVIDAFLENPSEQGLAVIKSLMESITYSKIETKDMLQLARIIVDDRKFIQKALLIIASVVNYRDDIIVFLKNLLKKYQLAGNSAGLDLEVFKSCVGFPDLFDELTQMITQTQCRGLFTSVIDLLAVSEFPFNCIRSLFYRLNIFNVKPIKKELTDLIACYTTNANPNAFQGMDVLHYLLYNSKYAHIRQGAAELIADTFTNWYEQYRERGESYLCAYMKNFISLAAVYYKEFIADPQSQLGKIKIYGCLEMAEQLLLTTEYFGVGSLPAHNSLVPTSTTRLKIYNNASSGDDVLRIFEKNIPSNWTLFQVIVDVSKQFKMDPLDVGLEYPNNVAIKHHGLTLEELKLNRQELNAMRLPQSRAKREPMLQNGQLTEKAAAIFKEIFQKYASNGRMGRKECANYIEGITQTYCLVNDYRISELFMEYDKDKDNELVVEDFQKFYRDCLLHPDKAENVMKNVTVMRYRKDLKRFDEPIEDLNEQLLFRHHLCHQEMFYEMLFSFTKHEDPSLRVISERLLVRLPPYPKVLNELSSQSSQKLSFENKTAFETEYILTTIQGSLISKQSKGIMKEFLAQDNHLIIFELLRQLSQKKEQQDKKCLVICLYILRSLLGYPSLKQAINTEMRDAWVPLKLPQTDIFSNLIKVTLETSDFAMLEPSLALQLTQESLPLDWIEGAVFNADRDIRIVSCNFLYYWQVKSDFGINLFAVETNSANTKEWFTLLIDVLQIDYKTDLKSLLQLKLSQLHGRSESLQGVRFDVIANGNLSIISHIFKRAEMNTELNASLSALCEKTISNDNRRLIYNLQQQIDPSSLACYLTSLSSTTLTKETELRSSYVGIYNIGCICYMNSILQQFFMIEQFKNMILGTPATKQELTVYEGVSFVDDFLYQLQDMYSHLAWSQKKYYYPRNFCLTIKDSTGKPINTCIQEDAHEFLNTALDKLQRYLKVPAIKEEVPAIKEEVPAVKEGVPAIKEEVPAIKEEVPAIKEEVPAFKEEVPAFKNRLADVFGGVTVAEIICTNCKNKIEKLEEIYHLSLDVQGAKYLHESLSKFIQMEEIEGYFCEVCKMKVPKITKQTFIKKAPRILIVNLKRITFDLQTLIRVKLHSSLHFPLNISLNQYIRNDAMPAVNDYTLKGVVIHSGTSEGGHYYSLIRQGTLWFKFNDQTVSPFDLNDLGKEAFGGTEESSQWSDHQFSTNAYILFYERNSDPMEVKSAIDPVQTDFMKAVLRENDLLYNQVQLCQESFFEAAVNLSRYYTEKDPTNISIAFSLQLKTFQILQTYFGIRKPLIIEIRNSMVEMLKIKSLSQQFMEYFLSGVNKYMEVICTHTEILVQQLYQIALNTAVAAAYDQDSIQTFLPILESILEFLEPEKLSKYLYKCFHLLQFWKLVVTLPAVKMAAARMGLLGISLDILVGSENSSADQKKKQDIQYAQAIPLFSIVRELLPLKRNLAVEPSEMEEEGDASQLFDLNEKETKLLSDLKYYKRLLKSKMDCGLISHMIGFMSHRNQHFSKKAAEFLLKSLNRVDEIEDKSSVFPIMESFLLIQDNLSSQRIKWLFGVPQLAVIGEKLFGLENGYDSLSYYYVSSLCFSPNEIYMPLLHSVFSKRKYYNYFSAYGLYVILTVVTTSAAAAEYLLSLPAPTYLYRTYLDWADSYILKLRQEDHYGFPIDKVVLANSLTELLGKYRKIKGNRDLPVNKLIIGKNKSIEKIEFAMEEEAYTLSLEVCCTYVLPNLPSLESNSSLPIQEFSLMSENAPIQKYFMQKKFLGMEPAEIQASREVLTFDFDCFVPLKVSFKIEAFPHTIYLGKGHIVVSTPYEAKNLADLLVIEVLAEDAQQLPEVTVTPAHYKGVTLNPIQEYAVDVYDIYEDIGTKVCKDCTFINYNRSTCEMCDKFL